MLGVDLATDFVVVLDVFLGINLIAVLVVVLAMVEGLGWMIIVAILKFCLIRRLVVFMNVIRGDILEFMLNVVFNFVLNTLCLNEIVLNRYIPRSLHISSLTSLNLRNIFITTTITTDTLAPRRITINTTTRLAAFTLETPLQSLSLRNQFTLGPRLQHRHPETLLNYPLP